MPEAYILPVSAQHAASCWLRVDGATWPLALLARLVNPEPRCVGKFKPPLFIHIHQQDQGCSAPRETANLVHAELMPLALVLLVNLRASEVGSPMRAQFIDSAVGRL